MNIVYCIPQLYNAGGMERVLTQKANYLASLPDKHITIVTTELTPAGKQVSYFPLDKRVKVVELNIDFDADFHAPLLRKFINHRRRQKIYRRKLQKLLTDTQADVCISLCGKEIAFLGSLNVPCRKLAEIHFAMTQREQLLMQFHKGPFWRLLGKIRTRQLQRAVRKVQKLVVLTHADEQQWRKAGVTNTVCIPNPTTIMPDKCGGHERKTILSVGRLHPQKGYDLLLHAWSQVASSHPDWKLQIVGEGDERQHLSALANELGIAHSVQMNGLSTDLTADYCRSGLFVLSSRYEGLPLALIEAMSCGCCCLAFDCPHGPAELISNRQTGILLPPEDTHALAQAINLYINTPEQRKKLGDAAYAYAKAHFALEPVMAQWLRLLG